MIIVDTSVLIYKNLFSAIKYSTDINGKALKKVGGQYGKYNTDDFIRLWKHKMINDLRYIYKDNKNKYGNLVLAIDNHTSKNWRKTIYPDYKGNRKDTRDKSGVDFEEFFVHLEQLLKDLEVFPFIQVDVPEAEGDDVIAILTENYYKTEDILIVTTDKDMKQLFKYPNIRIFNPLKLKMEKRLNELELEEWLVEHVIQGDDSDNIPKIVAQTEFSPHFISFLKSNEVYENRVYQFKQLSISNKLIDEYKKQYPDKDLYKTTRFGPVALKKFLEDFEINMNSNPLYKEHYKRNESLVLFENIPDYLSKNVLQLYQEKVKDVKCDIPKITKYFMSNQLMELYSSYQDFLLPISSPKLSSSSSMSSPNSSNSDFSVTFEKTKEEVLIDSLDNW
jgi:5'-3' exonuclease